MDDNFSEAKLDALLCFDFEPNGCRIASLHALCHYHRWGRGLHSYGSKQFRLVLCKVPLRGGSSFCALSLSWERYENYEIR